MAMGEDLSPSTWNLLSGNGRSTFFVFFVYLFCGAEEFLGGAAEVEGAAGLRDDRGLLIRLLLQHLQSNIS